MIRRLPSVAPGGFEGGAAILVLGSLAWFALAETAAVRAERSWRAIAEEENRWESWGRPAGAGPALPPTLPLEELQSVAQRWESWLGRPPGGEGREPPAQRADAYFELGRGVNRFRRRLREVGVEMAETERFGFATYRFTGPPVALAGEVLRQQREVALIVEAVGRAGAQRFGGITRELGVEERGNSPDPADDFTPVAGLSLRSESEPSGRFFRVTFSGETAALRGFLHALTEVAPPALVRWIEARPEVPVEPPAEGSAVPYATPLQFVVTVAFIQWTPQDAVEGGQGS